MSEAIKQLFEVIAKSASKLDRDKALRLTGLIEGAVLFSEERSDTNGNCC